jgi:hypothetical protein
MRILLLIILCAVPLCAQSWDGLRGLTAGERVVVQVTDGQEQKGLFRAVSADALTLGSDSGEISIEKARIQRVKVRSTGRRVRNLLIGAAIGVAVGAVTDQTLGTYFRNESGQSSGARAATYLAPIGIFGGIGAALPAYRTVYRNR